MAKLCYNWQGVCWFGVRDKGGSRTASTTPDRFRTNECRVFTGEGVSWLIFRVRAVRDRPYRTTWDIL